MLGSLGMPELLIILIIIMVIYGAGKLPQIGVGLGKAIKNFKVSIKDDEDKQDNNMDEKDKSVK